MFILRFRFENHRSFRDRSELTLVQARLRTSNPPDGGWMAYSWRTAGIYGANASGKSTVLEALNFMITTIRSSATTWTERATLPYAPFALDDESAQRPSHYALDFVSDGNRYEYGFSMTKRRIVSEWLYDYPSGRRRMLFERDADSGESPRFGRSLTGGTRGFATVTGPRELLLSRAGTSHHLVLRPLFLELTQQISYAEFSESDREQRLRRIVSSLAGGDARVEDLVMLLKVADVGIAGVEVAERQVPAELRAMFEAMVKAGQSATSQKKKTTGSRGSATVPSVEETDDEELKIEFLLEDIQRNLRFQHLGTSGKSYPLEAGQQSSGTLSWLSLAVPAIEALRRGGVLLVDELDASLHPHLAQVLIRMFKDGELNTRGAQLVFTTHDTYFLSPSAEARLEPEEVWFVEKGRDGASELYSLGDFPTRAEQNLSRRYLHGRYGATPAVAPAFLRGLVEAIDGASE